MIEVNRYTMIDCGVYEIRVSDCDVCVGACVGHVVELRRKTS